MHDNLINQYYLHFFVNFAAFIKIKFLFLQYLSTSSLELYKLHQPFIQFTYDILYACFINFNKFLFLTLWFFAFNGTIATILFFYLHIPYLIFDWLNLIDHSLFF